MTTPPGECQHCYPCAHTRQRQAGVVADWLGIGAAANKICTTCTSHIGGCPPEMIVPKPKPWYQR